MYSFKIFIFLWILIGAIFCLYALSTDKIKVLVNERPLLDVRNIFGYDCFVEETEEEIKIVRKLYDLLVFSMEPDDLNEQLKELESEDPKTCTFIYRFIKTKLNK